jgi:Flp pilus assembly protein TadG
MFVATFQRDETGAVFVEVAVLFPIIITVLFGSVDLLYAFYQWNAAAKAVEVGARIAAVSDPVASSLNRLSDQAVLNGSSPRSPMPSFAVTCNGSSETCTCAGACVGMAPNSYNGTAMNRIVFGRGSTACGDTTSYYTTGMCDVMPSITAANVLIVYQQTGLGYAGRPGGPVPTITVSLQNMKFQFFFLSFMLRAAIPMPAMTTTITAEDLCSAGSEGSCGS